MNSQCIECGATMVIGDRAKLFCSVCSPNKKCECCGRIVDELEQRRTKQKDGTYTEEAFNICKRCDKQLSTRQPKKVKKQ